MFIGLFALGAVAAPFTPDEDNRKVSSVGEPGPIPAITTTTEYSATVPPTTLPATTIPPGVPAGDDLTVVRAIDGDTIEVAGGTRVRLIGIDTPETVDPRTPVQCFGREASARTGELLPPGMRVRLVYDAERLDRFGRTLAYVYRLTDGLFVNLAIARDGYAMALSIPPNVAHVALFNEAVAEARNANRGLWAACQAPTTAAPATGPPQRPPATAPPPVVVPPAAGPTSRCHPSYAGACVPMASDVDCAGGSGNGPAYVSEKNFRVIGPDEYGLDSDNDGVGCESR